MELWVNPIHKQPIGSYVSFDLPSNNGIKPGDEPYYAQPAGSPNVDFETPALEALYGFLGSPPRPQAQPCIYESPKGTGDPRAHDQLVDIHHELIINHTARLSGDFIPWLINPNFKMVVTVDALPETQLVAPISLGTITMRLLPEAENVNVCFWRHADTTNPARPDPNYPPELLMNIKIEGKTCKEYGLNAEQLYKLIIRWGLWYFYDDKTKDRAPVGGFTEAEAFQVISRHAVEPD